MDDGRLIEMRFAVLAGLVTCGGHWEGWGDPMRISVDPRTVLSSARHRLSAMFNRYPSMDCDDRQLTACPFYLTRFDLLFSGPPMFNVAVAGPFRDLHLYQPSGDVSLPTCLDANL